MGHYITDQGGNLIKVAGNFMPNYSCSQLVREEVIPAAASSFTITNLDLVADGGIYDIVLTTRNSPAQANNLYFKLNNTTLARYFTQTHEVTGTSNIAAESKGIDGIYIGNVSQNAGTILGTIWLNEGMPQFEFRVYSCQSANKFTHTMGGYYEYENNVHTLKFAADGGTFVGVTKIQIFKRIINETSIGNSLNADPIALGATLKRQNDTVIESYMSSDGLTWYRIWESGWKECGTMIKGSGAGTWTMPVTFSNTNYNTQCTVHNLNPNTDSIARVTYIVSRTTNSLVYREIYISGGSTGLARDHSMIYCCGF